MKLIFIIGNTSVGKMTVGQELEKIIGLNLFHNHTIIEPVIKVFGEFNVKAIKRLREVIFDEFSATNKKGMIFTFMWAFNLQEDWDYVEEIKNIFLKNNKDTEFYYVELIAPQSVRLERNVTENRLKNKDSKFNVAESNARLISDDENYRLESFEGEIKFDNYIKIDNSNLSPEIVASLIKEKFKL